MARSLARILDTIGLLCLSDTCSESPFTFIEAAQQRATDDTVDSKMLAQTMGNTSAHKKERIAR